ALTVMTFTQLAVAREALLESIIKNIKVTSIAPSVQEHLKQASPEERKSLEAAIHTGNLFVPQYFSGNAYDSDPENKDWENETSPLISLDREEWEQQYNHELKMNNKDISSGKNHAYSYRLTCPQVSLISVQQDDDTTTLLYRTTSVGAWIDHLGYLFDFNLDGAGEVYDVRIKLDKDSSLVDEVMPPDHWITWSYTRAIANMQGLSEHPPIVLTKEQADSHTRKDQVAEMASNFRSNYQSTIQKIQESAATICK
ncbi:MAG: hypothetical protein WB444_09090, partial [Gallionella sp.]